MPLPLYYLLLVKVIETSIDTIRIMVTWKTNELVAYEK